MSKKKETKKSKYSTQNFESTGGKKNKEASKMDWKFIIIASIVAVAFIAAVWAYRLPINFAHIFIGHYDGTTDAMEEFKALQLTDEDNNKMIDLCENYDDWKQQNLGYKMTTESTDGASLSAYYYDHGSDVTVVMLHSFDQTKDSDMLMAPYFWAKGYNIYIPDMRDHGDSTGDQVSWGMNESQDLICELNDITDTYGEQQFILYGNLLGAGAELYAMQDLPDSVAFIIAENAYPDFKSMVKSMCNHVINVPSIVGVPLFHFAAKKGENFDINSVDVLSHVSDQIPVLLVYGSDEVLITSEMQQEVADAIGSSETLLIDGGKYLTNYVYGQETYEQKVDEYINKYIK